MKDTIKAKIGYHIKTIKNKVSGEEFKCIYDGDKLLFVAHQISYEDYLDMKRHNECFNLCEVFTTRKGNQFIYWTDVENVENYITKVGQNETL